MKKKFLALLTVLFALVLGFGVLTACGGSDGELTINEEEVTLAIGESHKLIARGASGEKIEWTTSDDQIVSITSQVAASGLVVIKANGAGQATVTAKSESGKTAECKVTVEDIVVEISGEGVQDGKLQMERYTKVKLTGVVKKEGVALDDEVVWSVEDADEGIVSVGEDGTVEALKMGTTNVTATRKNTTLSSTLEITVVWSDMPEGYYELEWHEQNKMTPNLWGYWADHNYEPEFNTDIKVTNAEYLGNTSTDPLSAGKVTLTYENKKTGANEHGVQIFYRSSKGYNEANKGMKDFTPYDASKLMLEVGGNYFLKMDITVSASGTITVNDTLVDVVANQKQSVEAPFTHTDDGKIHGLNPDGTPDYSNPASAVFLLMGAEGKGTMIQAATVTIENVRWEFWDGKTGKLATPSLSVNGKNVTIADTNKAGVKNFEIGLFEKNAAADADPLRVVTSTEKTVTIDDSMWPNGGHELRVRAIGTDQRYADSDWSAGVGYTVSHGAVQYDLKQGGISNALADKEGYYYYSIVEGEVSVETATYNDGTITLAFTNNYNWYSLQLFHKDPVLKNKTGEKYTLTFTLNIAGMTYTEGRSPKVRINGKIFDIVEGNNNIEVSYTEGSDADGLSMSIQFGEPNTETEQWTGTIGVITDATVTISNIVWTPYVAPEGSIPEGGQKDAVDHPGEFYLWTDTPSANGANVTLTSSSVDYENKTISFAYTSEGESRFGAGVQLFYELPGVIEGNLYTVTVTIKVNVTCDIRVCGRVEHFEANVARTLTFEQKEPGKTGEYEEGASFSIVMGTYTNNVAVNVKAAEVTVTNWSIVPVGETLSAPENFNIADDKTVTFTDTKNDGASYEIGFFAKQTDVTPVNTLPIASGDKIDDTKVSAGTYTVRVRAVKEGANSSEWSQGKEYTVTKAADSYELTAWEQNKITPNLWGYWVDAGYEPQFNTNIKVNHAEYLGDPTGTGLVAGGVTMSYENMGTGANEHGVQLFYRSSKGYNEANKGMTGFTPYDESKLLLEVGGNYILKMDITVSASGTITVNGTQVDVVANQKKSIEVPFEHTDDGKIHAAKDYESVGSAVHLLMGANNTMIQKATVTLENVRWEAWNGTTTKLSTPSLTVSGKNVTITDSNTAGVRNYTVGLFAKSAAANADPVASTTASGKTVTLDDSRWPNGEYELRVRANAANQSYTDSEWSAGVNYTVSHGTVQYNLKSGSSTEALAETEDFYYYNAVPNEVAVQTATYNNGVITLTYSGNSNWYSMQLFYKNPNLTEGTEYTLTFKLNSPLAGKIRINGQMFTLVAGDNNISVTYTEGSGTNGLSLDIQFGEPNAAFDGTVSVLAGGTFTLSNMVWTAGSGSGSGSGNQGGQGGQGNQGGGQSQQPSTPTGGTQMTKLNSKDGSDLVKGQWSYYAAANVTVTTATVSADGTVTVTVSGLKAVGDFTIFYTPEGYADGQQKTLVADYLFTSTTVANCVVTLNNCTAGQQGKPHTPGYDCNKAYPGQGLDFITTGGVFFSLTLGFVNGADVDEVPSGEVTLTISNITLA